MIVRKGSEWATKRPFPIERSIKLLSMISGKYAPIKLEMIRGIVAFGFKSLTIR